MEPPEGSDSIHMPGGRTSRRAARRRLLPRRRAHPEERAIQLELARAAAVEAGRDPRALEYTRWGAIDMSAERVGTFAAQGVTRIVVGPTTTEPERQRDEMSAFARRFALPGTG